MIYSYEFLHILYEIENTKRKAKAKLKGVRES